MTDPLHRRAFLKRLGVTVGLTGLAPLGRLYSREMAAEVAVIGGGTGGCAAALAALRSGRTVIMTEETDWIGGQLTQQAVPPDEHPWIEQFGRTRAYQTYRDNVRRYYRDFYPLSGEAYAADTLNPGRCAVSALCHEPAAAVSVLEGMLAPYVSAGRLRLLLDVEPVRADVDGDRIRSVTVLHPATGVETTIVAPYFLDATERGDLLPLSGTDYVTGAESRSQTGEPHAPAGAQPGNIQAMTWCFALDYRAGEDHRIDRPDTYAFWRDYVPALTPAWTGPLLSLSYSNPITLEPRTLGFDPRPGAETRLFNLWTYRQLLAPETLRPGALASGISLVNWPQNDYLPGHLIDVTPEEKDRHLAGAMALSRSLVYWLQTEAPREDGGMGWPGLRLRGDVCGTEHGLAKRPYIRESRRIVAEFTVKEQHVGLEARMAETGLPAGEVTAASFPDSVGVGSYRIDLHPSTGGDNYIDISSLPFEIPLGALLPVRMENLLPACKNLGVTHITNGCYRLHPVEWNIGESAGMLAAFCLDTGAAPRQVRADAGRLADFQRRLMGDGVAIQWPAPMAVAR
ncbi:MAG: FAD-dependent oxidoreductase [Rhodothermales bacterium]